MDLTVNGDAHVSMVGSGNVDITGGGKARCNGAVVEDDRQSRSWGSWDGGRWNWGP